MPSGNCLAYTEVGPQGNGPCPAKATGFSASDLVTNPMPANGATVSDLYAETSASPVPTGSASAVVAVIDNRTGATLLSCTVNSSSKTSCSNATGSGTASPGDKLEVQVTANSGICNNKTWRVTFRY